jgi:(2Fe-2S) ferredoxin
MVVYPQAYWYRGIDGEEAVDEILDALEEGKAAEKYLL